MAFSRHSENETALARGLDQQITAMESLRTCLEEEHKALNSRDPEHLLSIAERKQACLSGAAQINRQCLELESHTSAVPSQAIDKQRDQLDTLTRVCRDLNNVNGTLIKRQKTRVNKALQIMLGEPEQAHLYDPSGNTRQNPTRRILASI